MPLQDDVEDINHAISTLYDAADQMPVDHPRRYACLSNLGNSLLARFELLQESADIDNAVSEGHADRAGCHSNLGMALAKRFEYRGYLEDINNAILSFEEACNITPSDDIWRPRRQMNFGSSLITRFEHQCTKVDIDCAILSFDQAAKSLPEGFDQVVCSDILGTSFMKRYEQFGELGDIDHAIQILRKVIGLAPMGHPSRSKYLSSLGHSLL